MKKGKRIVFGFLLFVLLVGTMGCGYRPLRPKTFEVIFDSGDKSYSFGKGSKRYAGGDTGINLNNN